MPSGSCEMCQSYMSDFDQRFRRYCGPCVEYRRANGMRRVERSCVTCERKMYPMERELSNFEDRGNLCPGCYREDLRAKGGIPIVKLDRKGKEFEVVVPREKATPDQIAAYERGLQVTEERRQNRYDRPEVV